MDTTSFKKSILDALTKYVDNYVDEKLESFMKKIIEKHPEIEEDELVGMWNKNMKLEDEKKPEKSEQPKAVQPKPVKKPEQPKSVTSGCPYKFTRGDKAGKVCGVKSKNGDLYCSTHKKSAPAETVKPPQRRQSEVSVAPSVAHSVAPSVAPSVASSTADEYKILKMHKKLEKPWNKATGFLFKSPTERVVIGKLGEKDTIEKLTDEDIEMCKKFHFKIAEDKTKQLDFSQKTINKTLGISEDDDENEDEDEDEQDD